MIKVELINILCEHTAVSVKVQVVGTHNYI
jgi:hypothetical protein